MEFEIEFNIEFDFGFNFGGGSEPPYTMKIWWRLSVSYLVQS